LANHALLGWQRRRGRRLGVPDGHGGSVTYGFDLARLARDAARA